MRATEKQRETFRRQLRQEYSDMPVYDVDRHADLIMRHAATYCRLQEMTCSVEMSERQQQRHERKEEAMERRIAAICAEFPSCWRVLDERRPFPLFISHAKDGWQACKRWLKRQGGPSFKVRAHGIIPDFQGDPRGFTVRLKVPSGRSDIGVPTS